MRNLKTAFPAASAVKPKRRLNLRLLERKSPAPLKASNSSQKDLILVRREWTSAFQERNLVLGDPKLALRERKSTLKDLLLAFRERKARL
jgi:hypothetical protein